MFSVIMSGIINEGKEKVGIVTEQEKNAIENLHERINSLEELILSLDNMDILDEKKSYLYKKALIDKNETEFKYNVWWRNMSKKYNWKGTKNDCWEISFKTNEVFLEKVNNNK